jgi:hypothetical protein
MLLARGAIESIRRAVPSTDTVDPSLEGCSMSLWNPSAIPLAEHMRGRRKAVPAIRCSAAMGVRDAE